MTLVAIEGIDGSGKGTQAGMLVKRLEAIGLRAKSMSFPQYETTVGGGLIGQYLDGQFGLVVPKVAAMLFAIDRLESRTRLLQLEAYNDAVVLDRYVGSNQAHQSARLVGNPEERTMLSQWIHDVEFVRFKMPRPELTILIDISVEYAVENIKRKGQRSYTAKAADAHEADLNHMTHAAGCYRALEREYSSWVKIEASKPDGSLKSLNVIGDEIFELVTAGCRAIRSALPLRPDRTIDLDTVAKAIHPSWCAALWEESPESVRDESRMNARAAIDSVLSQLWPIAHQQKTEK